ncbi:MAG: L-threonylcarbamoyladenylate synthase [bacterium]|nr:L-threonylcarbamoyladenylate synthase [bacterium]
MSLLTTSILDASKNDNIILASQILKQKGLVAFPTETVYGLGALGLDSEAVERIFIAKQRPPHNPLILHVANSLAAKNLFNFAECSNPDAAQLLFAKFSKAFWPGPLTLVCNKNSFIPNITTAGLNKVAVRVPNHPIALQLLKLVDAPIAAPSANASTRPSSTSARHVQITLDGKIDAILNGGSCLHGLESTVVDISSGIPQILRLGAVSIESILKITPNATWKSIGQTTHESSGSPGLTDKHYAPKINQIELVEFANLSKHWKSSASLLIQTKSAIALEKQLGPRPINSGKVIILSDNTAEYAKNFYDALYQFELNETSHLILEKIKKKNKSDLSLSILDRLIRASSI